MRFVGLAAFGLSVFFSQFVKLTIVTETFPPEINGVALTLSHLARGLARRGHTITVLRPWRPDLPRPSEQNCCEEITVPGLPIPGYRLLRFGLPARRHLRKLWTQTRPDIVHVVTEGPLGATAISAARDLGVPVSSSFHTNFHEYMHSYGLGWLRNAVFSWLRWFHNRTDLTLAPTAAFANRLKAAGFNNVRVLSRGVDLDAFNPARRCTRLRTRWGAAETATDNPVVLHVGRLAPEKDYPLLFACYNAMRAANPRCRFVLVGDGPLRADLQKAHPDFIFEGPIGSAEIGRYFASADLYVHASRSETFGNVVLEALASGLAVAGFNYAAAREWIRHNENGLMAPMEDEAALITAAVRLASSEPLAAQLRQCARACVMEQSWESVISTLESEFERLLYRG